ncbi:MAG: DNA-processing protein DprA [Actinomycetota bacterium]
MSGFVAALAGFEKMTVGRLRTLLDHFEPETAYAVAAGHHTADGPVADLLARNRDLAAAWRVSAARRDPVQCAVQCRQLGIVVVTASDDAYPPSLLGDPWRPAALFVRGDLAGLERRRVGIVGTRNATQRGREHAARFATELTEEGVTIVSGLAKGIDAAAHRGALTVSGAQPVAVVGNGLDRPYPQSNRTLWADVAERGAVVSEWPPGTPPDAFRFPLRNRIIAAFAEALIVVESRDRGGSLITAREAAQRDVAVFAVPGGLDHPASVGTNALLRDGAAPATETLDILIALGLDGRRAANRRYDPRAQPCGRDQQVVDRCAEGPCTLEQLAEQFACSLSEMALAVARLERDGWLRETAGWFETLLGWDPG